MKNHSLLSIENLQLSIKTRETEYSLLKQVNIKVNKGEIVGLIGESGSGKSLTMKAIMGLLPGNISPSVGTIMYKNNDLLTMSPKKHRSHLGKEIGFIFQDYRGSFTPFLKVGKQIVETIRTHDSLTKKEAVNRALSVLEEMGLDPIRVFHSYPFQLSGGQVQRAAIAMTLALRPSLLVCDEVTTALDVMSGERVLNYIEKMRQETDCAVLMITHDLTMAYKRTDRIYVMNKGEIVEEGLPEQIWCDHQHPYTKKLCSCVLSLPGEDLFTAKKVRSI